MFIFSAVYTVVIQETSFSSQGRLVAVMIAIFRQMTGHHFEVYIGHFMTLTDLLDFLMEILLVFKDLVSKPVYPKDWCEMIMLQNR
jgi:dedicator of cytokinesis protein 1